MPADSANSCYKTRTMRRAAIAALVALLLAASVSAQDRAAAETFRRSLVNALAGRNHAAVANMIKVPATALVGGFNIPIYERKLVRELWPLVFTPELRCELEQKPVAVDAGGASLAGGRVRVVTDGGALRITRINVPPATGAAPPPPSKPQQAWFRQGQSQFAGRLYGDGVDAYLVSARKGARFEARIEKFPGRSAFVRVLDPRTGKPMERPGADAPRVWAGTLTEEGQYRVEVVRLAPYCEPPFTYLLTMTLR